ncbi:MAG: hypothetical protein C5B56_07985 [Proteobacteria bacterium]|nr:MAG: hypothetical protein C5B56_07985 [Pseudomonadota bacterium]
MGMSYHREQNGGVRVDAALVMLAGAFVLAACSLGSSIDSPDPSPSLGSRFANLFSSAKPGVAQPAAPTPSAPEFECPGVDIRAGASTLNIAAKTAEATAGDLRYQLSFGQTARECSVQSGNMSIKVGVQGRLIVGPMGGPGSVDVPLRYAVVREGPQPKTVATRFKRITVSVASEQTHVQFVDVEEGLTFPLPDTTELSAYVIYVGFDEIGDKNEKRSPKASKKSSQR